MGRKSMREIRVGGMIIAGLTVIVLFVFMLGGDIRFFKKRVNYQIHFNDTAGLYEGDVVLLTGVEVGNVQRIGFSPDPDLKKIVVEISVDIEASRRIREDTRAKVGSASIVYGKVVALTMGSRELPAIPPGGLIPTDQSAGFSAIMDSTGLMIDGLHQVISKIDRGEGMLGMLVNEPMEMRRTLRHLAVTTEKLSLILQKVEAGKGGVGTLLSDSVEIESTLRNMNQTTNDLKILAEKMNSEKTLWGRIVNDESYGESVSADLKQAIHALANIATKLDTAEGSLGMLLNDPELYIGMQDVVIGAQNSKLTKWFVRGRRKAGEKVREEEKK